jgi:glucose repression mediator protein
MMQMQHQAPPPGAPPQNVQPAHFNPPHQIAGLNQIAAMNEAVWLQIGMASFCFLTHPARNFWLTDWTGSFSELLRVPDEAMHAYERALQANPNSIAAMNAIGMLLKGREAFDKALEFFRAIVQLDQNNGEAWGNLGMPRCC